MILEWLTIFFLCGIAVVGVFALFLLATYLLPYANKLYDREIKKFGINYRPCCPPGLGCNEDTRSKPCRRDLAYQLADEEETQELDRHWSAYNRDPSSHALASWELYRDELITRKVNQVENNLRVKALLGAGETIEIVTGEVESMPVAKSRRPRRDHLDIP